MRYAKWLSVPLLAAAMLCGCTKSDELRAKQKAREAGREIKQELKEAGKEVKQGVEAAKREIKKGIPDSNSEPARKR